MIALEIEKDQIIRKKLRIINDQLQNLKTQGSAAIHLLRHHLLSHQLAGFLSKN